MKEISVADYLVEILIANGIKHVFGYQGGMICHVIDSFGKYSEQIQYHNCISEQGASFAACGYAQSTGKLGVIITTSGPGFTNALTGLANAWFDSIPILLISGQVNTKDKRHKLGLRQYGFQEIQSIPMAMPITKRCYELDINSDIPTILNEAVKNAFNKRKGPIFIDLPINIEREIISVNDPLPIPEYIPSKIDVSKIFEELYQAKKPLIIAGAGIRQSNTEVDFLKLITKLKIPVVTTMAGSDLIPTESMAYVGYFGGTGRRLPTILLRESDFVLSLGTRLCNKAIGYNHEDFIPKAKKFVRIDLDPTEFERSLKNCEKDYLMDLRDFIPSALKYVEKNPIFSNSSWISQIQELKQDFEKYDLTLGNKFIKELSYLLPEESNIVLDVGNNLIYGQQSTIIKKNTRLYASYGLGSMGYAIPASIGVALGTNTLTIAISGDGGAQMNIQELNFISRNKLPLKIIVLNDYALGHITLFQDHYLDKRRIATIDQNNDYYSCNFTNISKAFGIRSARITKLSELNMYIEELLDSEPLLLEFVFDDHEMLPNIHGGLDPLSNGPSLPEDLINKTKNYLSG